MSKLIKFYEETIERLEKDLAETEHNKNFMEIDKYVFFRDSTKEALCKFKYELMELKEEEEEEENEN